MLIYLYSYQICRSLLYIFIFHQKLFLQCNICPIILLSVCPGFAIWSKKSDKELQRELKKALEKKALNIPEQVAMIVRAVYIEKTQTLKSMKKEFELDYITFRKWVIEQKKKTKKDPLPMARIEVSKVS